MAQGNFRDYLQGENVKVKKYFYVLRPLLAMKWIQQDRGIVPMEFEILVNELIKDKNLKEAIYDLLEKKRAGFESSMSPRIEIISQFIEDELMNLKNELPSFETERDYGSLNDFFVGLLNNELKL